MKKDQRLSENRFGRRELLGAFAATGLLALPGCATLPELSLSEAIRRLLTVSSQQAFASLLRPDGFYNSQIGRISLPDELGGSGATTILSAILRSRPFQDRLQRQVNRAAAKGAEIAAPLVADMVRGMSIEDAIGLVNGGGQSATDLLARRMGPRLVDEMVPAIGNGLRLFDSAIVSEALRATTGIDIVGLGRDVSEKASSAIYREIGAREASIRANPEQTNDPLLIAVFGRR